MATQKQQKEFIEKIAPLIREEAKKRGYLVASPIIAQAICESGWGLSTLASKYHNYFGLKSCQCLGIPVHHTQATIDIALVIQIHKYLDHTLTTLLIHREGGAVPVA